MQFGNLIMRSIFLQTGDNQSMYIALSSLNDQFVFEIDSLWKEGLQRLKAVEFSCRWHSQFKSMSSHEELIGPLEKAS
jgi:hypothetical protein